MKQQFIEFDDTSFEHCWSVWAPEYENWVEPPLCPRCKADELYPGEKICCSCVAQQDEISLNAHFNSLPSRYPSEVMG